MTKIGGEHTIILKGNKAIKVETNFNGTQYFRFKLVKLLGAMDRKQRTEKTDFYFLIKNE